MIHSTASIGFENGAEYYQNGRPGYPKESIDFIIKYFDLNSESACVDLGAGTGKLTKALVDRGLVPVAIEPVPGMQRIFRETLPQIECLSGLAEKIPLENNSQDIVFVAQAFHWFQGKEALAEIARILRPNGYLVLMWNTRDESVEWVSELTKIIDPVQGTAPRYKSGQWLKAFQGNSGFSPLQKKEFSHVQKGEPGLVVDRVASVSFISALDEDPRLKVMNQVKTLLKTHPQTKGKETISFPYKTDLFWCRKSAGTFSK